MITKKRKKELKAMHYGSLQSQKEFKDYLSKYVYLESRCMNSEVSYILNHSDKIGDEEPPFCWDDVTNLIYFDVEEAKISAEIEFIDDDERTKKEKNELKKELNKLDDIDEIEDFCSNNFLSFDKYTYEESNEVYTWYIMDERIITQLEERGEPTLNNTYWGRCTFGQAIELDGVIIEIFKEWYLELYGVGR